MFSLVVIAALVWTMWRLPARPSEVVERKLTASLSENSVSSAAVSPDGKYLAYADNIGIYPCCSDSGCANDSAPATCDETKFKGTNRRVAPF